MTKRKYKKNILVFFLTIIIVIVSFILIIILFSNAIPSAKKNTQNNETSTSSNNSIVTASASPTSVIIDKEAEKLSQVKTISGKSFNSSILPYKAPNSNIKVEISNGIYPITVSRCASMYKDGIVYKPDSQVLTPDYINQLKDTLKNIDIQYDGNNFDYYIDPSC